MKKSLLAISLAVGVTVAIYACNRHQSNGVEQSQSTNQKTPVTGDPVTNGGSPVDSSKGQAADSGNVIHNEHKSPEQAKIDSIKAAKLKEKQGGK